MARRRSSPLGLELVLSVVLALVVLPLLSHGAPVQDAHADLQQYSEGCYYNYNHYNEGNRIVTNEPCLNCTCHNKMLMCYLRVCPFTKPIGHDCTVEKREDQCCPIITCPEVRVDVSHNHQLTTSAPGTELSIPEKYGCNIDSRFYPEGAQLPSNPNKPCELCYCIRNRTSCLMQECTLHIDGCQPIYNKGSCCPVRYNCDHENELLELEDLSTTTTTVRPTPGYILTSTASPVVSTDCVHNNEVYADGASITGKNACEHCYCMRGDIVCAVQECEMPTLESGAKTCRALPPAAGECCPSNYVCDDDSALTESPLIDEIPATTTAPKVPSDHLHESVSQEDVQLQEHIDDKIPATEAPATPTRQPSLEQGLDGDLISGQSPPATEAPVVSGDDEEDKQSQGEDESPLATTALPIEIATTHKTEDELEDTHAIIDQDKEHDSTQAPIETDTKEKDVTTIAPLSEEPQKSDEETNEEDDVSGEKLPTTAAPVDISKPEEPSVEEKPVEDDIVNVEDLQKPIGDATTISSIEKDEEEDKEEKPSVSSSEAPTKKIDLPVEDEESESSSESSEPSDITTISSIDKSEDEDKKKKPVLVVLGEEPSVPSSEAPPKKIDLSEGDGESESSSESLEPSDITTISSIEKSEEEDEEKKPSLVDLGEEPSVPSSEAPPKRIDLPKEDEEDESSSESSEPSKETSVEQEAGDKIDEGIIEPSTASPVYEMVTQGEDSDISMPEVGDHKTEVGHKDDEEIIAATSPPVVPVSDGEVKDKLPSVEVDSTTIPSAVEADQAAVTTSKPSVEDEKPDIAIKTDDATVAPVESEESSSESEEELGSRPPKKESAESSAEDQKPLEEADEIPAVVQEVTDTSGKPIQGDVPKDEIEPTSQTTALPISESATEVTSGSEESEEEGTSSEEESKEKPISGEDKESEAPTTVASVDASPAAEVTTIASVDESLEESGPSTSADEKPVKEILDATTIAPAIAEEEGVKGEPEKEITESTTIGAISDVKVTSAEEEEISDKVTTIAPSIVLAVGQSDEKKEPSVTEAEKEQTEIEQGSGESSSDEDLDATTVSPQVIKEKDIPSISEAEIPSAADEENKTKPDEASTITPEAAISEEDKEKPEQELVDSTTITPLGVVLGGTSAEGEKPKIKPEQGIEEATTVGAPALEPEAPSSEEEKEGSEEGSADSTTVAPSAVEAEVPSAEDEKPKIKPDVGIAESSTLATPALEPEAPSSEEEKEESEEGSADSTTVAPSAVEAEVPSAQDEKPKIKPDVGIAESSTLAAPALEPEAPSSEEEKEESEEGSADSTTVAPSAVDAEVPSAESEQPKIKPEQGIEEATTVGAPALEPESPISEEDKEEPEEGSADSATVAPSAVDAEIPSVEEEEPKIKPAEGVAESSTLAAPALVPESPIFDEDKEEPEEGSADSTTDTPSAVEAEIPSAEVPSAEDEETKIKPEEESSTIAAPAVQPEAPISGEDKEEPEKTIVDSTTLPASAADEEIPSAEDEEPKIKPEPEIVDSSTLSALEDESGVQGLEDEKKKPQEGILDSTTIAPIAAEIPSAEDEEVKVKPEGEVIESSTIAASAPESEEEEEKEKPQEGAQDSTTVAPSAAEAEIPSAEEEKIKHKPEEDFVESSTIAASEESGAADLEQDKTKEPAVDEKPDHGTMEATTTSSEESEVLDEKVESKPDATTISPSLEKDDTKDQQEDQITGTEVIPSSAAGSDASKPEEEREEEEKIKEQEIAGLPTIAPSADDIKGEEEVKPESELSTPEATTVSSTDEKSSEEDGDKKEEDIVRTTISSLAISDEDSSEIVEAAEGSGEQSHEMIPAAIPGEGDCLYMDETYANNASVPTSNGCELSCICANSIVTCKRVQCYEPPKPNDCILDEASTNKCCPQYICGVDSFAEDQRTTTPALAEDEEIQFTTLASPKPYPGDSDESVVKVEEPVKSSEAEKESSGQEPADITTKKPEEEADKDEATAPSKLPGSADKAPAPAEESSTPSSIDVELPTAAPEQPLSHVKDEEGEKETSAEGSGEEEESTENKIDGIPLDIPEATTIKAAEESVTAQPALTDIPSEPEKPKDEVPVDSSTGLGVPKIDESIFAPEEPETESTTIKQIKPETDAEAPSLTSILGAEESESEDETSEQQTESGEEEKEESPATVKPVEQSTITAPIEGSTIIAEIEYKKPAAPEDMSHIKIDTELPAETESGAPTEAVSGDKSEESSTEKITEPTVPPKVPVSTILTLVKPPKKTEDQPEISDKKDVFPAIDDRKPEKEAQPVDQSTEQESVEKDESLSASVAPASGEEEPISGTAAPVSEAEADKDVISSQPSGSVTEQPAAQDESSEKEEDIASPTSAPISQESEEEDKIAQPTIAPITDKIPAEVSGRPETTDKSVEEKLPTATGIELDEDNEIVVSPTGAPAIAEQPPSVTAAPSAEEGSEEDKDEITSQTSSPVKEDLTPQIPTTIAPAVDENEISSSEEKDEGITVSEEKKPLAEIPVEKDEQQIDVTTTSPVSEPSDSTGPVKPVETGDEVSVDAEVPESSTIIAVAEDVVTAGAPISPVAGEEDSDSTEAPVDSIPVKGQNELDTTEASIKPIEKEDTTESSEEEDAGVVSLSTEGPVEKEEDILASTEAATADKEEESVTGKPSVVAGSEQTPSKADRGSEDEPETEPEKLTERPLASAAGADLDKKQPVDESTEQVTDSEEQKTEQPAYVPSLQDVLFGDVQPTVSPTEVPKIPQLVSVEEISSETSKPDAGDQILVDEVAPEIIKDTAVPTESSVEEEVPDTTEKKPASDEVSLDAVKPAKEESQESTESGSEEEKESSPETPAVQTEKPSILKEDEAVVAPTGKPEILDDDKQSATDKPISSDEATESAETAGQTEEESSSESEEAEKEKEAVTTLGSVDLTPTTVSSLAESETPAPSQEDSEKEPELPSVEAETPAPSQEDSHKEPELPSVDSETLAPSQEESEKEPELVEPPKEDVKVQTIAEFVTERVEELTTGLPILDVKKEEEPVTSSEELSTSSSEEEEPEAPVVTEKVIPAATPVESTDKPQAPEISEEDQKEETPVTESAIAAEIPIVQSDDKYNTDLPKPIVSSEEETPLLTTLLPLFPQLDLTTASPALNASDKIDEQVPVDAPTSRPVYASPSTSAPTTEQSTTPQAVTSAPTSHYQPTSYGHVPPQYPTYTEDEYTDEDETEVFGPGTCRYGGKLFVSAQQIPRDDPCDFCFCFRSDIICLQQSCPPPISGCHEEPISGFCCPRYECPVSMATVLNITTSTTTTSTTLPPHFLHHAYRGAAEKNGCHISGKSYKVGDKIDSASGPCMHCTCGGDGQMKCDPKTCSPEPMLRQMIAVVASRRR